MEAQSFFSGLIGAQARGEARGICSVCSAQPYVLEAAMEAALEGGGPVLIEATANQVNQHGGYTGMTPADFRDFVYRLAGGCAFPREGILLGGDHLGPLVWKAKPEAEAMALARELVYAYAAAGFVKIHLDTSMRLGDDDPGAPLADEVIARRGAELCRAAEEGWQALRQTRPNAPAPVYVIGSEVPVPGGPQEEIDTLAPTAPAAFLASQAAFGAAFEAAGLRGAFGRVVAFVVQPGVEFTGEQVFGYDRAAASSLCAARREAGGVLFEGHSTDYQTPSALSEMVEDGIGILKVGPALTFALREGLFALEAIEKELFASTSLPLSNFAAELENAMLADDKYWRPYCHGNEHRQRLLRRYSYFDRARYYLKAPAVEAAMERLLDNLQGTEIPPMLLSQYMPQQYDSVRAGALQPQPRALMKNRVRHCLSGYWAACRVQ